MQIRTSIWYRRIAAGFLLLIMALVTDIQVLHSHPSKNLFSTRSKSLNKKSGSPECNTPGPESRCFICDYQLTKDADAHYASYHLTAPVQHYAAVAVTYSFSPVKKASTFETRGPPSMA